MLGEVVMTPLESLVGRAAKLAETPSIRPHESEAARVLQICNACRYCEGFCAVFPAMTRRLQFEPTDIHYLANLCHNCGACLHACQYAPPHEFLVNVPRTLTKVRRDTYQDHMWPSRLATLYRRHNLTLAMALAACFMFFLTLMIHRHYGIRLTPASRSFYDVFPHYLLTSVFGAAFGFALIAITVGAVRFWRSIGPGVASMAAVAESLESTLQLRYLGGGHEQGCNEEDDRFTLARRRFHHLTFYGFLLCFAATVVATGYHYLLGAEAPYNFLSVPVLLGTGGGLSLLAGLTGQLYLSVRRDPLQSDTNQQTLDRGFIALLYAVTVTGLALLQGRDGSLMGLLLAVHLATVLTLFLTLPYGKFVHGVYRLTALLKYAVEKRQPNALKLGGD
jgi:citrate/tricarballylate utilization protein